MNGKNTFQNLKRFLTLGALLSLLLIIAEILSVSFFKSSIIAKVSEMETINRETQSKSSILETHFLLKKESEEAIEVRKQLNNRLASKDDLLQLSAELGLLAKASNVNVSASFSNEKEITSSLLGSIGISITADGSFPNLIKFIKKVEAGRFLIKLDNFDLTTLEKETGDDEDLRLFLRGDVIYRDNSK